MLAFHLAIIMSGSLFALTLGVGAGVRYFNNALKIVLKRLFLARDSTIMWQLRKTSSAVIIVQAYLKM